MTFNRYFPFNLIIMNNKKTRVETTNNIITTTTLFITAIMTLTKSTYTGSYTYSMNNKYNNNNNKSAHKIDSWNILNKRNIFPFRTPAYLEHVRDSKIHSNTHPHSEREAQTPKQIHNTY